MQAAVCEIVNKCNYSVKNNSKLFSKKYKVQKMKSIRQLLSKCFINGAGSILNIFGDNKPAPVLSGILSDKLLIKNDWYSVGNELRKVLKDKI